MTEDQTIKGYILFTGNMPMQLEPETKENIDRALAWQLKGGNRPNEYKIGQVFLSGYIQDVETGNAIIPEKGIYTQVAFDKFLSTLNGGK